MAHDTAPVDLVGVLVRLREALVSVRLPLDGAVADEARRSRDDMVHQLDDYVLPRLLQIDAPLLAVVGGSTGAGKSTLVNSLVGEQVSAPGVLRPTTRSPVLVHHPDDAHWFAEARVLPELARTTGAPEQPAADPDREPSRSLHLVASDRLPPGLAVLDAPDIDSVEERNRVLAGQLLAAADLWLFVTSAARYADQVPWEFLRTAAERSTAVAVVLDRTPPEAAAEVGTDLARLLSSRGLGESPLFTVPEAEVDGQGLLPEDAVAPIRDWLSALAADASARHAVVRKTLDGAIRSLPGRARQVADEALSQAGTVARLRADVDQIYGGMVDSVEEATQDGTMLRGEVLARWQEFVGTGELLRLVEERVGRLRDRITGFIRGRPQATRQVSEAVETGLQTLLVEHAESAAERSAEAWRATEAGRQLLSRSDTDLSRASRGLNAAAERSVRDWQHGVLELVRSEGADRRSKARYLAFGVNGLSVALMVVVFVHTAGITGAEAGIAGGSAVVGQKLLEAVFGDQAVRRLASQARQDLRARVETLFETERARYHAVLDDTDVSVEGAQRLRDSALELDQARLEEAGR